MSHWVIVSTQQEVTRGKSSTTLKNKEERKGWEKQTQSRLIEWRFKYYTRVRLLALGVWCLSAFIIALISQITHPNQAGHWRQKVHDVLLWEEISECAQIALEPSLNL